VRNVLAFKNRFGEVGRKKGGPTSRSDPNTVFRELQEITCARSRLHTAK
jgi:hypothetical protein